MKRRTITPWITWIFALSILSGCSGVFSFPWVSTSLPFTWKQAAAGGAHACGLTERGAIKCWGSNLFGQMGDGTKTVQYASPQDVQGLDQKMTAVSAGTYFSCGITQAGGVKCWGTNWQGELGNGSTEAQDRAVDVMGLSSGVIGISLGYEHACALLENGTVKCWGANGNGQLGNGTNNPNNTPVDVAGLEPGVTAIAAGNNRTCAITKQKNVFCWGENPHGELGDGSTDSKNSPVGVQGLTDVQSITLGGSLSCALTGAGEVWCWGDLSVSSWYEKPISEPAKTPVRMDGFKEKVRSIDAGNLHVCALDSKGNVLCWGQNTYGQLGDGTVEKSGLPVAVEGLSSGATAIAAGYDYSCAVTNPGWIQCWGKNDSGQLGDGAVLLQTTPIGVPAISSGAVAVTAGYNFSCAQFGDSAVKCWGGNEFGQLGDGTRNQHSTPTEVQGLQGKIRSLASNGYTNCVLTAEGEMACWGNNTGQISGVEDYVVTLPTRPTELGDPVRSVALGAWHVCALTEAGEVFCWGDNAYGQLGDGSMTKPGSPVKVNGLSESVTIIAAGSNHTCAASATGGVKCWGENRTGQLGDGTTESKTTPVDVRGIDGEVIALTAGSDHTCALMKGGRAMCWGGNYNGQLGDGSTAQNPNPVEVRGPDGGFLSIAAGYLFTCAVTEAGGVDCWGSNFWGQLGDGTFENRSLPTEVVGLNSGVKGIAVAWEHVCALTEKGGVKCWGADGAGQMGIGTVVVRTKPIDLAYVSD
jgi:alpha-tubulin suppressor-like RCC1 family protein